MQLLGRNLPLVIFLFLSVTGMLAAYWYFSPPEEGVAQAIIMANNEHTLSAPIFKNVPSRPVQQRLTQSPGPIRIGLIAGHKGNDSGSVCADGLTEAAVNEIITQKVAEILTEQGVRVEVLDEFDDRLKGFSGTAVVSIHADSCDYINELATGFKIAGSSFTNSSGLLSCVQQAYFAATGMPYHENTITPHMTDYHAFREIAPGTPAIIIETGFLNLDREILTTHADLPARGIADGILCYLGR